MNLKHFFYLSKVGKSLNTLKINNIFVGGDNTMDDEKMRLISTVLMLITAFIELLKCLLWD